MKSRSEVVNRPTRVSDGRETISELLLWSFGHGNVGRTYLFQRRGSYYERWVTYYLGQTAST